MSRNIFKARWNVMNLTPPLIITVEELNEALDILSDALQTHTLDKH